PGLFLRAVSSVSAPLHPQDIVQFLTQVESTMAQITARLPLELRARFDEYAADVGLDAAELARLLITRELRNRRILRTKRRRAQSSSDKTKGDRKLTAHFHQSDSVAEFDKYVRTCGFSRRQSAARLIFERELDERWLLKALSWTPRIRRSS